jgi:hypothetical protein
MRGKKKCNAMLKEQLKKYWHARVASIMLPVLQWEKMLDCKQQFIGCLCDSWHGQTANWTDGWSDASARCGRAQPDGQINVGSA